MADDKPNVEENTEPTSEETKPVEEQEEQEEQKTEQEQEPEAASAEEPPAEPEVVILHAEEDTQTSENVAKKTSERLGRLLCVLCFLSLLLGVIVLARGNTVKSAVSAGDDPLSTFSLLGGQDGVAIVKLSGLIAFDNDRGSIFGPFSSGADKTVRTLRKLRKADHVKGVVLRVNSPGGTVAASQEIHDEIKALVAAGKKVVVSMGDVAASGGYYVSAPANYIYANAGTLTGSIGVITSLMDYQSVLDKIGVQYKVFKSGRFKDMGAGYRDMSNEEKELFNRIVMGAWDQFVKAVADGRMIEEKEERDGRKRVITSRDKLRDELCQGQIFLGSDAKEKGLVDELGSFHDAISKCGELCGLGKNPHLIRTSKMTGFEKFVEMFGAKNSFDPMKALLRGGTLPPLLYLYVPGK